MLDSVRSAVLASVWTTPFPYRPAVKDCSNIFSFSGHAGSGAHEAPLSLLLVYRRFFQGNERRLVTVDPLSSAVACFMPSLAGLLLPNPSPARPILSSLLANKLAMLYVSLKQSSSCFRNRLPNE